MKGYLFAIFAVAFALCGCRREDVREMAVVISDLNAADSYAETGKIERIVRNCGQDGVYPESFRWDLEAKTLYLKYDSMKIAQANIRSAIDEEGIRVEFPKKTDDHAGY